MAKHFQIQIKQTLVSMVPQMFYPIMCLDTINQLIYMIYNSVAGMSTSSDGEVSLLNLAFSREP